MVQTNLSFTTIKESKIKKETMSASTSMSKIYNQSLTGTLNKPAKNSLAEKSMVFLALRQMTRKSMEYPERLHMTMTLQNLQLKSMLFLAPRKIVKSLFIHSKPLFVDSNKERFFKFIEIYFHVKFLYRW